MGEGENLPLSPCWLPLNNIEAVKAVSLKLSNISQPFKYQPHKMAKHIQLIGHIG